MKKNGFTLIELLAVIVILAIIALIATPIVLNIINDTKESVQLRSVEFYLDAVENAVATSILNNKKLENKTYNIVQEGNLCLKYNEDNSECVDDLEVKVSGEVPSSGAITLENGKIKDVEVVLNNKTMIKDNDKWLYSGLYDENDNLIATWGELVNNYGIDVEKEYSNTDSSRPGSILSSNEKLSKGVKLVIDSSVTKIGKNAFSKCTNLKEIIIPNSVISISNSTFSSCTNLEKITIKKGVQTIGNAAFSGCTNLKEVIIPNSVTSIGANAFNNCKNLKEITIPDSVTSISDFTFSSCTNLNKIIIGNGVTSIGKNAFEFCKNLKEITIPNSVTSIGGYVFYSCYLFDAINYMGSEEEWNLIQFEEDWDYRLSYTINYNYMVK